MIFSCIIPCSQKDLKSQKLKDLIASIKAQDFPQDEIEILIETEGDSEQAKANGIRKAKGEICAMFCADNYIVEKDLFKEVKFKIDDGYAGVYANKYFYSEKDNSLNRYFSLFGGNDPICWYLGKNDRIPYCESLLRRTNYLPSYGCNGFFYKAELIKKTNLDHYYPMDNALEVNGVFTGIDSKAIWHRTSENLISFLTKRYKYARDLYCDRRDRRWRMLDTREDYMRLVGFIASTLAVMPCLFISIRGFIKIKDWAWFLHYPVCLGFLITYTLLAFRNLFKYGRFFQCRPSQSSFPLSNATTV